MEGRIGTNQGLGAGRVLCVYRGRHPRGAQIALQRIEAQQHKGLGQLSSSRTRFSVIKLILTLYILITAFAPLQSLGDGHVTFDIPEAPQTVQAPDTEAMVLNTVCTRLEDTVRSALAENGIAYTEVDVALDADSETVEVADVTVIVPGDTDVSGVEDVVTKALGTHVPVTVNEEG